MKELPLIILIAALAIFILLVGFAWNGYLTEMHPKICRLSTVIWTPGTHI